MSSEEHQLAGRGLAEALRRLEQRLTEHRFDHQAEPLIPLAEVLAWLYALEELWVAVLGRPEYFARRRASEGGRTTGGLIYARRLVQHQMAAVGALTGPYPFTLDLSWLGGPDVLNGTGEWRWRPATELVERETASKDERAGWYRDQVAERPLLAPLEEAQRFLVSLDLGHGPR